MKILIKNGRVIDPANDIDEIKDLYIDGAGIARPFLDADMVIDAKGLWVAPGFIDLHVHLREPGQEHKEDMQSGAKAAVKGGFTTICAMPNTTPKIDNVYWIEHTKKRSAEIGLCNILPIGAITKGFEGKDLTDFEAMKNAGMVAVSEDGMTVKNTILMSNALKKAAELNLPVFVHCEDVDLVAGGVMHSGKTAEKLGLSGISSDSEAHIVARDIFYAEKTKAKLHICHISTDDSLRVVRKAIKNKVNVTAEVCPHHFTLCDEDVAPHADPNFKMNPPLRNKTDVEAMKQGLKDGMISAIATDHAPHHADEKAKGFADAPFGIVGLETALPLSLELVEQGIISASELISKLSTNPAKILGIDKGHLTVGAVADITIIDSNAKYKIDAETFVSKSKNTPFDGRDVKGRVVCTIVNGRVVYDNR